MARLNCGHNVNIFIPGITEERDLEWKQDFTEQYELRQQENNAKRQIKQWERRAEVAKANGDQMAYKTAKNKAKEWKEKRKDIAQKRKVEEKKQKEERSNEIRDDKKQREERFSRPRGKAFPLDSSSLKSQKNDNKGQSSGGKSTAKKTTATTVKKTTQKTPKTTQKNSTERAKEVKKLQQKASSSTVKRDYKRTTYDYRGLNVPGWETGKANNFLGTWNKEVKEGYYGADMYDTWWMNESKQMLSQMTPDSIHKFIRDNPE